VLGEASEEFVRGPRCRRQRAAFGGIAVGPALDPAKHVVEEDRLRARPAAPQAAEKRGEEEEREPQARHPEEEQPGVLRRQGQPEEVEPAVRDIEKDRGIAVHRNPRQQQVDADQHQRAVPAAGGEAAADVRRVKDPVRAVLVDGRDRFPRRREAPAGPGRLASLVGGGKRRSGEKGAHAW